MSETVYVLCALTSIVCATLLLRAYGRSRVRLLLWSGLCFLGLAGNNVLLVLDLVFVKGVDLSVWRQLPAVLGVALLVYGLVWEAE